MRCQFCERPAWYRCARTGVFVCPQHAKLEVVAPREEARAWSFDVRPATAGDHPHLRELALDFWGETEMECFESSYEVTDLPGFAAFVEDQLVGFLSYAVEGDALKIVMLNVLPEHQGQGVAKEFLKAAEAEAQSRRLSRLVVATSNDNLPAWDFYQRLGFVIEEVLPGRMVEYHSGVEKGFSGVGVRDEIRLQLLLPGSESWKKAS